MNSDDGASVQSTMFCMRPGMLESETSKLTEIGYLLKGGSYSYHQLLYADTKVRGPKSRKERRKSNRILFYHSCCDEG